MRLGGSLVNFICYLETHTSAVPHMEVLPVKTLPEARLAARRMLSEHRRPIAAHIFRNDERVDTLIP